MNTEISHKNFKGQFEDEHVLCYFRKHWIQIIPRLSVLPLFLISIFVGFLFFDPLSRQELFGDILVVFGVILMTYLIHRVFLDVLHFYLHTVMITNYRIVEVDRSVFLRDSKTSIDLANVQDIQKKQSGLMQSLFNYGSLIIVLSGTSETLTLNMVPRPEYQFKKINQVKSTYLPKRTTQFAPPSFFQAEMTPERAPLGLEKSLSFAE